MFFKSFVQNTRESIDSSKVFYRLFFVSKNAKLKSSKNHLPVSRSNSSFWQVPNVSVWKHKHWKGIPFLIPMFGISSMAYASCEQSLDQSIRVHLTVCMNQRNQRQLLTADLHFHARNTHVEWHNTRNGTKKKEAKKKTNHINSSIMTLNCFNNSSAKMNRKKRIKDYVNNYLRESLNDLEICVIHHEFRKSADFYGSILSHLSSVVLSTSSFFIVYYKNCRHISFALTHCGRVCVCVYV